METARVLLRRWTVADAEALLAMRPTRRGRRRRVAAPFFGRRKVLEIIQTVFQPQVYAIVLKETGEPVGSCGIMFADGVHSAAMGSARRDRILDRAPVLGLALPPRPFWL